MNQVTNKILMTERMPLFEEEKKILERYARIELAESLAEENLITEAIDADIIMVVYAKITEKVINSAKKLKGIVRYGIGVDNIDIKAATARKIPVANVPDYCVEAVADHTFALILTLCRKITIADESVRRGKYVETWTSPPREIMGIDLKGKTLGLIGLGKIGRAVVKRAKNFGIKVVAYDPYMNKKIADRLKIELVDLENLFKNSDFVSIHAALTPETRGMIGEKELRLMKKTSYLINVARGPIVKEEALYTALKDGWIAGAGIDVYEKEPPEPQNPLFSLKNVVFTPHIAWYTQEALQRLEMSAVNETIRILQGRLPKNLVNKDIVA